MLLCDLTLAIQQPGAVRLATCQWPLASSEWATPLTPEPEQLAMFTYTVSSLSIAEIARAKTSRSPTDQVIPESWLSATGEQLDPA